MNMMNIMIYGIEVTNFTPCQQDVEFNTGNISTEND